MTPQLDVERLERGACRTLDFDRLIRMANLYVDKADFVFLSRQTGLTAGTTSSHMTRLEAAGYVDIDKSFVGKRPRTTYILTDSGRAGLERYRQHVGGLLTDTP